MELEEAITVLLWLGLILSLAYNLYQHGLIEQRDGYIKRMKL